MNILTVETCGGLCSVALFHQGKLIADSTDHVMNMQAEHLFPLLQTVLSAAKLQYKDLHTIGITIGPGSFTGIRVGLAAAYAISTLINIPLIGINTLELMAHMNAHKGKGMCATVAAGRGRFYCQKFSISSNITEMIAISDIQLLESSEVQAFAADLIIVGDYVEPTPQINAIHLGSLIHHRYPSLDALTALDKSYLPKPLYIARTFQFESRMRVATCSKIYISDEGRIVKLKRFGYSITKNYNSE